MPDLPTLTVTDAQANRMLAAYGSVANYKLWLREKIIEHVLNEEEKQLAQQFSEDIQNKRDEVNNALGD